MAAKYTPETNTMPHLVVKIVGSKQVKYFVEGPNKGNISKDEMAEDVHSTMSNIPEDELVLTTPSPSPPANQVNEEMSIYQELQKIRDRQCATAPCGDRSLSYIHVKKKSLSAVTDLHKATQPRAVLPGGREEGELKEKEKEERQTEKRKAEEEEEKRELMRAVREELIAGGGWGGEERGGGGGALMENIEGDMLGLDSSRVGTLHQAQLSYALLRNRVPLTLPTLARLFQAFAKDMCPDEVDYGKLLHFLRASVENDQTTMKADDGSHPGSRTSQSARRPSDGSSAPTNGSTSGRRWVDRFQEMERALHLCDSQNTGFLDKDKARRLIQNYNVILDLSLSPVKIAEATRTARAEGKIHLASTLQLLRGL